MPMILPQDEGLDVAGAVNSSIMASAKMGHRHCRKVDSNARQLHLCSNRSRIFHKMDRSKAAHKCDLHHNQKNLLRNIICRYGVPGHVTVDNAKYFDNTMFKEFCQQIGTKVAFTSVYHPQSNRGVEKGSSLIFQAMKKILEGEKKENGWRSCQWQYVAITQQSAGQQISQVSVNVRNRSNATRRDKTPKLASYSREYTMPQRSRGEGHA
jgi:hypothetical protein